jgi:hypothetical protein
MSVSLGVEHFCPVRRVGQDDGHHFFGYYNKNIWDKAGRYMLALRVPMMTGDLTGREVAEVGYFDLENGESFKVVDTTTTWNWQMGCQLQWLDGMPGRRIIYNVRAQAPAGRSTPYPEFQSCIRDIETGQARDLPLPVYVVAPDSTFALCVDYSRFMVTHKTIGYAASQAEPELANAPADDGVYRMDLTDGSYELVLSLDDLRNFQPVASMDKAIHWITHMEMNPSSSRVLFIHRWTERVEDETCFLHRLFTMNPDGSDLRLLECTDHPLPQLADDFDPAAVGTFDYEKSEYQISHPIWCDERRVIVWAPHNGSIHYHLYDEASGEAKVVGERWLTENGHMTYLRGGRWLLSDTYPDDKTNERLLILYDSAKDVRYDIGSFYTSPDLGKHNRCDLHPRWSRDGRQVCIDSVHEHERQLYVIDVESLTKEEV